MPIYNISVGNTSYPLDVSNNVLVDAITSARSKKNEAESNTDLWYTTNEDYLTFVFGTWAQSQNNVSNTELQTIATQAIYSWAGLPNPNEANNAANTEPTPVVVLSKSALIDYANLVHVTYLNRGCTIGGVHIDTGVSGRANLTGAYNLAKEVPNHVFDWVTDTGAIQIPAANIIAIATGVGLWVQSLYTALGTLIADINNETITTVDEINSYSWPSNIIS